MNDPQSTQMNPQNHRPMGAQRKVAGRFAALAVALCALFVVLAFAARPAWAQTASWSAQAEALRSALFDAQLAAGSGQSDAAMTALAAARDAYDGAFALELKAAAPAVDGQIRDAFAAAQRAIESNDLAGLASARGLIWGATLHGAYQRVIHALTANNGESARAWLLVREYRHATRISHPGADATLAVDALVDGQNDVAQTIQAVRADLLDNYQARLYETLEDLEAADRREFAIRRAELAGLAAGYFAILAPFYAEQRGSDAADAARAVFTQLSADAASGQPVTAQIAGAKELLLDFRAAPLSPAAEVRRAGQMVRFLALIPVEYGRGVRNGQVHADLEIREAITLHDGASAAFADLRAVLKNRDESLTKQAEELFGVLDEQLSAAISHSAVAEPQAVQGATDELARVLNELLPAEWLKQDSAVDFDMIATALDQMERAVAAGDYLRAETARLDAYALLESGPEAQLIAFAPQHVITIEEIFNFGQGSSPGLAFLLQQQASFAAIRASRAALDEHLAEAEALLGGRVAPTALLLNAAIIVFREGLEAVVILAALMASMIGARRIFRRPMLSGVLLAFVASALTWWLMQTILSPFRVYGERLEAVVSIAAIGVLLLITNWFFHRVYWTDWMADLHTRKKAIMGSAAAGQIMGFVLLGFTSVYREGFETVLFLQALVLQGDFWIVFQGVALGMSAVLIIGVFTFSLQSRLPYKKMLVVTGVLISAVLLVMVGNTVHSMQLVGWMPVHPLGWLSLPYWAGMWFGLFATWEGVLTQGMAATFVIGSYFLADWMQHQRPAKTTQVQGQQVGPIRSSGSKQQAIG